MRAATIALGMGTVGLLVGFAVYYNRSNSKASVLPDAEPPMAGASVAAQLAGLGYLPSDTNIAFAIQPGPLLAYAKKVNRDPKELIVRAGMPTKFFDSLANLGLTLPQLDHVVGGTCFEDATFTPRLCVVLSLHKLLADEDDFLRKLKAHKQGSSSRFEIELAGIPLQLARVSPTLWVFGWDKKDFSAVDRGGFATGAEHLPFALRQEIAERVPPNAAAWIAANDEQWAEKPGVRFLLNYLGRKEWLSVLARWRSGVIAVSFADQPRVGLFLVAADEKTGQQLRTTLQQMAETDDKMRYGGSGTLAYFDTIFDPMFGLAKVWRLIDFVEK